MTRLSQMSKQVEELRRDAMKKGAVTLSRKELYDLVWTNPVQVLAPRFGLSDVGLAKICKKHDIPRPGPGYWAKVHYGKPGSKADLQNSTNNPTITIQPFSLRGEIQEASVQKEVAEALERLYRMFPAIIVPERLTKPHPLISEEQKAFKEMLEIEKKWPGSIAKTKKLFLHSKIQQHRAMVITDTLFKTLEELGFSIDIDRQITSRKQVVINLLGSRVQIGLRENSGKLKFIIDEYVDIRRKTWTDSDRCKVEEALLPIIEGLIHTAGHLKERAIKRAREHEEYEAKKRQAEGEITAKKAEEKRITDLISQSNDWCKARQIREYVEAVRAALIAKHGQIVPGSEEENWIQWALERADRMDPLERTYKTGTKSQ